MRPRQRPEIKIQRHPPALVLLSGGIDSSSCIAYYLSEGFRVRALFVDYGQASAKREQQAARLISKHFRVSLNFVKLSGVARKGPGLIIGRNALLLLVAAMASVRSRGFIAIGIHAGTSYSDCSPGFKTKMQAILDLYCNGAVQIGAPFLRWRKRDIWSFAIQQGVPLELTYSCERGKHQPCGRCKSCRDVEVLRAGA